VVLDWGRKRAPENGEGEALLPKFGKEGPGGQVVVNSRGLVGHKIVGKGGQERKKWEKGQEWKEV